MRKRANWRELLDSIIQLRSDRERIAAEVGVSSVTLTRWASGDSMPRSQNLRLLLTAIPLDSREQFKALIEQDMPSLSLEQPLSDSSNHEIPFSFINTVMTTRATGSASHVSWVIIHQVLQHALLQLDPHHLGMKITLALCMPPTSDGKIHSLREGGGLGTPPWEESFEEHALFLGAETLAGYSVMTVRYRQIPDLRADASLLPYYRAEYEVSAAACPILFLGQIAGCVLFSSTQPDYFSLEERSVLIHGYTNLISLALREEDFYPLDLIELRIVPPPEKQQDHLMNFQSRVVKLMRASASNSQYLYSSAQAEQIAWQQIEAELLNIPFHTA
jgi:transcriptional regulator with XRE-family HTH domain